MNLPISKFKFPFILFCFLIFANSLPILCNTFFLTLDGPAHLYNAKLVLQVLYEKNELLNKFYDFNNYPEPNLTGHLIMQVLLTFMPPWLAEKSIQLLYIFGFPISFYYYLKLKVSDLNFKYIYFFPFIYAFTFVIGFYNYCLSLILFFICLSLWHSYNIKATKIKLGFLLITFLILYFSHALVFLFCLITIFTIIISEFLNEKNKLKIKSDIVKLFLTALPGLLFISSFFFTKQDVNQIYFLPFSELVMWVINLKPVVAYGKHEELLTIFLFSIYTFSALGKIISRLKNANFKINYRSDVYLILSILFGIFIFIIPDKFASGGFISMRLIMFSFFFLIIWLCTQNQLKWIDKISLPLILAISASLTISHSFLYAKANHEIIDQQSSLPYIKPNSTLLPLNYSSNWLQSNMSNYLGTYFPLLILDNYEASHKPFQLHWKRNRNPYDLIGEFAGHPPLCADITNFESTTGIPIDYIMTWKKPIVNKDSCSIELENYIRLKYDTVFISQMKYLYLFEKKY